MSYDPESYKEECLDDSVLMVFKSYEAFKQRAREGKIGKTAQFWLIYLDLMGLQHKIRNAVQTNNFDLRLDAWNKMLPYYFAFNKTNYARYGTWHVQTMKDIDERYPGLKQLLKTKGLSIQAQSTYPLRTSIDQRGEQSINRDAKTAGKYYNVIITFFYKHSSLDYLVSRSSNFYCF